MKSPLIAIPAAALLFAPTAFAASAGGGPSMPVVGGSGTGAANDHDQLHRKQHAMFAALQQGKRIQIADGGTLTQAHRAEVQRKLDAVQAGNY